MKIKTIENLLYLSAIVIIACLQAMDKDLAEGAFILAVLIILIALCLPQWEKNNYRWNLESVPGIVKVIGLCVFCGLLLAANTAICGYRLGGIRLVPNILGSLVAQSFTLAVGSWIYLISYPQGNVSMARAVKAIALGGIAIYLLNFVFYSNPGDLYAELKPTLRCYPGGSCYSAGPEQWGGYGAILLLTVNLLQGILIANAAVGCIGWLRNKKDLHRE